MPAYSIFNPYTCWFLCTRQRALIQMVVSTLYQTVRNLWNSCTFILHDSVLSHYILLWCALQNVVVVFSSYVLFRIQQKGCSFGLFYGDLGYFYNILSLRILIAKSNWGLEIFPMLQIQFGNDLIFNSNRLIVCNRNDCIFLIWPPIFAILDVVS